MAWLWILLVLAGIAVLPVGVRLRYSEAGAFAWLLIGPVRKKLYPKSGDKPTKVKKAEKNDGQKSEDRDQKGGSFADFLPLVKTVLAFLNDFRHKLRVTNFELHVIMAGDDPCDLAENYGRACATVAALEPQLERVFTFKRKKIQIDCDFLESKSTVFAGLDIIISLGGLLFLIARYGFRALREYINMKDQGKGGVKL